jgi:CRP-like cAMP-binding protein
MSKKLECLRNVSIFSGISETHLEEIASIIIEKKYNKNKVIFNKGNRGSILFILYSGSVKLFLFDQSGKEMILKMIYVKQKLKIP